MKTDSKQFIKELKELCIKHKIQLSVSGHDSFYLYDLEEVDKDPLYSSGISDRRFINTASNCID